MSDTMRSLNSFGVASFLKENCTIYYTSDFRSRSIGRLSDLMAAKLREVNADELKIRAILLYGLYESYAAQGAPMDSMTEMPPVQLEIGVDEAYVAIGITFHAKEGGPVSFNGMKNRVMSSSYQTRFDELLGFARQHCTQLIVRYESKENRVEVVTLLHRHDADKRDPIEVLQVDTKDAPLLEVGQFVEMGDLNYIDLTKEVSQSAMATEAAHSTVEGDAVSASIAEKLISGDRPEAQDDVQVVKTSAAETSEDSPKLALYERQIEELQARLRELSEENEKIRDQSMNKTFGADPEENKEDDWGIGFLKQMWPFKNEAEGAITKVSGGVPEPTEEKEFVISGSGSDTEENQAPIVVKGGEVEDLSDQSATTIESAEEEEKPDHLTDVEKGTEQALEKIRELASDRKGSEKLQKIGEEITKEVDPSKARRWVDGMMAEVVAEKAKLSELTKTLSKQVRSRELEYRSRERGMMMELSKRDESIRQKDVLIEKKNDQLAQVNLALERQKSIGTSDNEQQLKIKLTTAQKLATMKEEENKVLITKVKDLENKLIVAQAKSSRPSQDPQMAAKLLTAEKKVDEYKRINQRLMDQLNNSKEKGENQELADMRRKLEMMDRQLQDSKKNMDKQQFRMRELQESEKKLQVDLQRALDENRKLRTNQAA